MKSLIFFAKTVLLFSILGLISCGPDDPDQPSKDNFEIKNPRVRNNNGSQLNLKSFVNSSYLELKLADTIVFEASEDPVQLNIFTQCTHPTIKDLQQSWQRPLEQELPVQQILPKTLFTSWNTNPFKDLSCDFKFIATNSLGSVHSFSLLAVPVVNSENWAALQLDELLPNQTLERLEARKDPLLPLQLEMHCEQAKQVVTIAGEDTLSAKAFSSQFQSHYTVEELDSFQRQQQCRLIEMDRDRMLSISTLFQLQLPPPRVVISYRTLLKDQINRKNVDASIPIGELNIDNRSSTPVHVYIPAIATGSSAGQVRVVTREIKSYGPTPTPPPPKIIWTAVNKAPVSIHLQYGAHRYRKKVGNHLLVTMKPYDEINIRITTITPLVTCHYRGQNPNPAGFFIQPKLASLNKAFLLHAPLLTKPTHKQNVLGTIKIAKPTGSEKPVWHSYANNRRPDEENYRNGMSCKRR